MSISLADALETVELEPGRTYECDVRGQHVELRVFPKPPASAPAKQQSYVTTPGIHPDDIRLDAWCELPEPPAVGWLISELAESPPVNIPEIPSDEDSE